MARRKSKKGGNGVNWTSWQTVLIGVMVFLFFANWQRSNSWNNGWSNELPSQTQSPDLPDFENNNAPYYRKEYPGKEYHQQEYGTDYPTEEKSQNSRRKRSTKQKRGAKKSELKILTWNLNHLGQSKDAVELEFIADVMKDFDMVAVQEVVTSFYGAKAAGQLVDQLDRSGENWDYALSDKTTGSNTERYAFFWKKSKFKIKGSGKLEKRLEQSFDREPMLALFEHKSGETVLMVNYHARTIKNNPEIEISLLDDLYRWYEAENMIICGDFNLPDSHLVFDELRREGMFPVVQGTKTSLKMNVKDGVYVSNPYDNVFYEKQIWRKTSAGVIDFVDEFMSLKEARKISDHLPVWTKLEWK